MIKFLFFIDEHFVDSERNGRKYKKKYWNIILKEFI